MKSFMSSVASVALLVNISAGLGHAEELSLVHIPAQSLEGAINELSDETGLLVIAPTAILDGFQTQELRGSMSGFVALRRLLANTDLEPVALPDQSYVIRAQEVVSQDARETQAFDLGTIVLRGELIERDLQDSQTSAFVATGDEIDERGETSTEQIIPRTAGVFIVNDTDFVIRGVQSSGTRVRGGGANASTAITVSLDGVRISDFEDINQTRLSTFDLEQVEVLRGPQSTQTGRNALFGAIILKSRDPQFEPEARLRFGASNFNGYQAAAVGNSVLIEDTLAFRFSFDKRETDGFFTNILTGNDRSGSEDVTTMRFGLRYEPTDRISAVFKYTMIDDNGSDASINIATLPPGVTVSTLPAGVSNVDFNRQHDIRSLSADLEFRLTDALSLTSTSIYSTAQTATDSASAIAAITQFRSYDVYEQEFRLNYEGDRTKAVVGAFYTSINEDSDQSALSTITPTFTLNSRITERRVTENYALFGEAEVDLNPSWKIIAGARYDVETFDETVVDRLIQNNNGIITPLPPNPEPASGNTYDAFLPKLGIVYDFDEDRSLGLTYQRGHRAGGSGVNPGRLTAGGALETYDFDQEFTDTVELAYRSQFNGGLTTFNANAFYTQYDDIQIINQNPLNLRDVEIVNGGSAELWGIEADLKHQITSDFNVFASAAYYNTEYGSFAFRGTNLGGNDFAGSPDISVVLGAEYFFGNRWRAAADASYIAPSFADPQNTVRTGELYVVNAQLGYQINDKVSVSSFVRNMFDQDRGFSSPPREFGVFLDASF